MRDMPRTDHEMAMARLDTLAKVMDSAFEIPGTGIRMGIDGLLGFVPVAGDVISSLVSSYVVWEARRLGAPKWLVARMMWNVGVDTVVGSVPVVGDAFDVMFRANRKNVALLRRHLERNGKLRGDVIEATAVRG